MTEGTKRQAVARLNARYADLTAARLEGTHGAAAWAALKLAWAELGAAVDYERRLLRAYVGMARFSIRIGRWGDVWPILGEYLRRYMRRAA